MKRLLDELHSKSPRLAHLWGQARPAERRSSSTETVRHPELGERTLDSDAFNMPDSDQRMIVYSAAPNTSAAEAFALLRVVGLQRLTDPGQPAATLA